MGRPGWVAWVVTFFGKCVFKKLWAKNKKILDERSVGFRAKESWVFRYLRAFGLNFGVCRGEALGDSGLVLGLNWMFEQVM